MSRNIPLLVAVVIILSAGVVHGFLSDRWALSPEPKASADRLKSVATVVGDWEAREGEAITDQEKAIGKIEGYLSRYYVNRHTGFSVRVQLLCGRPGPIGVHPPDVCFVGGGHQLMNKSRYPLELDPALPPAEFFVGQFRKSEGDVPTFSRAFWTWSADGNWTAPSSPRWTFAGKPALFKLYLSHQLVDENELLESDPTLTFAKLFLPELKRTLFSPSEANE
jgi:hypothetical protein